LLFSLSFYGFDGGNRLIGLRFVVVDAPKNPRFD
jgi:hypothetical protein